MGVAHEIHVEFEPVQEAFADLVRVHKALSSRRGLAYRKLERDIEDGAAALLELNPAIHDLGEGFFVMSPPEEAVALLRRARALRLI
jgi:hypothetical protein